MVPPNSSPDERQSYLWACLDKKLTIRDPLESLQLDCSNLNLREEPNFYKDEAHGLYARVKEISRQYLRTQRGNTPADIQLDLADKDTLSQEVKDLGQEFGKVLWGKQEPGFTRPVKFGNELDWDNDKDKDDIHFYIRCWILRLVVAELDLPSRKRKPKPRAESLESGEISDESDWSVPHRAPTSSHNTSFDGRNHNAHTSAYGMPASNATNRAAHLRVNVEKKIELDNSTKRQVPETPSKRKASDPPASHSTGKLQRVSKETGPQKVPFRPPMRNPYSIPPSPPNERHHSMSPKHRRRESTQDPDGSYRPPRCDSAETEPVCGPELNAEDESAADAVEEFLQNILSNDEEMQDDNPAPTTAGPPDIHHNPNRQDSPRQDSVIPSTQAAPPVVLREAFQVQKTFRKPPRRDSVATSKTLSPRIRQDNTARRELYPLILCYLTSINEFDPSSSCYGAAEKRMDTLLREIWHANTPALRRSLRDPSFERLDAALSSWLGMRDRLTTFQSATEYYGQPGEEWKAHLRAIEDPVERVKACIAYNNLKGWEGETPPYQQKTFDDDLALVFHLLTNVRGCNGAEEFKPVAEFNKLLLVWVREEEGDEMAVEADEDDEETEDEMEGLEVVN